MKPVNHDWKVAKQLMGVVDQRHMERTFAAIDEINAGRGEDLGEAYDQLRELIKQTDQQRKDMFDYMTRNQLPLRLLFWKRYGLITDEEVQRFSAEMQKGLNMLGFEEYEEDED